MRAAKVRRMDPVSHATLGAAIGIAVMGRRAPLWKAAAWGSVCGTLPDLDVLADYGNPILDMTLHRSESHALVYLSLLAPVLALVVARLNEQIGQAKRWWLMTWLALLSHRSLDVMTVYGTRLGLPITDQPFAVGSIFIIDPLLTLPLLVGAAAALLLPPFDVQARLPGTPWPYRRVRAGTQRASRKISSPRARRTS